MAIAMVKIMITMTEVMIKYGTAKGDMDDDAEKVTCLQMRWFLRTTGGSSCDRSAYQFCSR